MVIPDWLFNLFAAIGLVDTEEKKIQKMIAGCKEELSRFRELLEMQINEAETIEREIRKLQPKYEEAQGPSKGAYAEIIKPLLQKRAAMAEKQRLLSDNMKAVTAQLAKLENLRDLPRTPERTDALETLVTQIQDLNDDMRDQNKVLEQLEKNEYKGSETTAPDLSEFTAAAPADARADESLEKELSEICGTASASSRKADDELEA